jgi:hypothetical protein
MRIGMGGNDRWGRRGDEEKSIVYNNSSINIIVV